jgi:hypothetical protein
LTDIFQPITRERRPAKILLTGAAGAGKTRTAMEFARAFGTTWAVAQTEPSAELYKGMVPGVDFRAFQMDKLTPQRWIEVMEQAAAANYDGIILDSISDEWHATLQVVDSTLTSSGSTDGRQGWRVARPPHNAFFLALQRLPIHVIATCKSKMEYDWSQKNVRQIGLEPIQDNDLPYYFDMVVDMAEQTARVTKVRGFSAAVGLSQHEPTYEFIEGFAEWLKEGDEPVVGEGALQRLRTGFPDRTEDEIRAAVRQAGVNTRGDLFRKGWFEKAEELLGANTGAATGG